MSISVIIPFTKGEENRQKGLVTLLDCIKRQTYKDYELILAEMTRDGSLVYLPEKIEKRIALRYDGIFNKSWVINHAVKKATHEHVLVIDADTLFEDDYFQCVVDYYEKYKNGFFVAYTTVHFHQGRDEPTPRSLQATYIRAAAHAFFFTKKFFWSIGGMNEKYFGYGAEDQDLWYRAQYVEKILVDMPYDIWHTYHDWHPKDSSFPLNPKRVPLLDETKRDPRSEIDRLVKIQEHLGGDKPYA